MVTSLPE